MWWAAERRRTTSRPGTGIPSTRLEGASCSRPSRTASAVDVPIRAVEVPAYSAQHPHRRTTRQHLGLVIERTLRPASSMASIGTASTRSAPVQEFFPLTDIENSLRRYSKALLQRASPSVPASAAARSWLARYARIAVRRAASSISTCRARCSRPGTGFRGPAAASSARRPPARLSSRRRSRSRWSAALSWHCELIHAHPACTAWRTPNASEHLRRAAGCLARGGRRNSRRGCGRSPRKLGRGGEWSEPSRGSNDRLITRRASERGLAGDAPFEAQAALIAPS